jgi:hypothetical protein
MSMMKEGPSTRPTAVQLCTVPVYIIVNSFIAVGCVEGPSFDILTDLHVLRIPVDNQCSFVSHLAYYAS